MECGDTAPSLRASRNYPFWTPEKTASSQPRAQVVIGPYNSVPQYFSGRTQHAQDMCARGDAAFMRLHNRHPEASHPSMSVPSPTYPCSLTTRTPASSPPLLAKMCVDSCSIDPASSSSRLLSSPPLLANICLSSMASRRPWGGDRRSARCCARPPPEREGEAPT